MNVKAKALGKRVTNAVGSALSAPSRARQAYRGSKYGTAAKALKTARGFDGAPDFDDKGVTPAFKARSVAEGIRSKYKGGVK